MENETENEFKKNEILDKNETVGNQSTILSADDFNKSKTFIRVPEVGETIELEVIKVESNPIVEGKNKETGKKFKIGIEDKNGLVRRYDITSDKGIFTINSWEIYWKLLGNNEIENNGLLLKYSKEHDGDFCRAKISIKRCHNGSHASRDIKELALINGSTEEEAKVYRQAIKDAMSEKKLYEVKLLN